MGWGSAHQPWAPNTSPGLRTFQHCTTILVTEAEDIYPVRPELRTPWRKNCGTQADQRASGPCFLSRLGDVSRRSSALRMRLSPTIPWPTVPPRREYRGQCWDSSEGWEPRGGPRPSAHTWLSCHEEQGPTAERSSQNLGGREGCWWMLRGPWVPCPAAGAGR